MAQNTFDFAHFWSNLSSILSTKLQKEDVFSTGTTIADYTDLDALTTTGLYRRTSWSQQDKLTNCPTQYAFQMEVTLAGSSSFREQRIYESYLGDNKVPSVYRRFKTGESTWSPWYKYTGEAVT